MAAGSAMCYNPFGMYYKLLLMLTFGNIDRDPDLANITPFLIRCVFGNPFRPVSFEPSWLTSTVLALAEGIYHDRAFDRLPILADALQDAGCDTPEILEHCRGDGPHSRGCWPIDLILGKS